MCVGSGMGWPGLVASAKEAVARLGEVSLEDLGHAQLAQLQRDLRGLGDQVELAATRALAALERCGGYRADGAGDPTSWLVKTCKLTPETAHDRVTLARSLELLPATTQLLESGELNFEQATVVARSAAKVAPEDARKVEGMILAKALTADAGRLRQHAAAAVAEVDRDALARDVRRARQRRSFTIGPDIDGSARVSGDLTSECAALLRAGMEPFMRPAGNDDARTAGQRRHDAVLELARQVVDGDRGGAGRRPRQLVVVAPLSAMLGEDGPPALLQGLVPITQEELGEITCDAALSAVLLDSRGNIAYAGKSARTFSPAKRRAMLARHPTCAFEGCNRPAIDCDGHHIVEFNQGGKTTIDVDAPACSVHHPMLHGEGWAIVQDSDGTLRTLHPGHPDNPRDRLSPVEYLRRRDRAMSKRVRPPRPAADRGSGRDP